MALHDYHVIIGGSKQGLDGQASSVKFSLSSPPPRNYAWFIRKSDPCQMS